MTTSELTKEFFAAVKAGRAVFGVFRTAAGEVFSASWEYEFPGRFISGQGGTVWSFIAASEKLAAAAGV